MTSPRILFISKNVPYPPIAGSSQRTAILYEALSKVGEVTFFIIGPPSRKPFLEAAGYRVEATAENTAQINNVIGRLLNRMFPHYGERIWRVIAGVKADYSPDPGLAEVVNGILSRNKYDLIVGRYLGPTAQSGVLMPGKPPVIIDVDDVDTKSISAKIASPATHCLVRAILKTRLPKVKAYEAQLWRRAAKLWFSNPDDLARAPSAEADVIPNIPFVIPARESLVRSPINSKTILWVGSFNHSVNLEGVDHFLMQIWARIVKASPDARFRIIGSHLPDAYRDKWESHANVDVVGFAESLHRHYADAALSIVPLMDGAGTKIKVLESLAFMRTCVVTRHSIAGFEALLRNGESVRVGNDLHELVEPITELLNNAEARWRMEEAGRTAIEEHFTQAAVNEAVARSLRSACEGRIDG